MLNQPLFFATFFNNPRTYNEPNGYFHLNKVKDDSRSISIKIFYNSRKSKIVLIAFISRLGLPAGFNLFHISGSWLFGRFVFTHNMGWIHRFGFPFPINLADHQF